MFDMMLLLHYPSWLELVPKQGRMHLFSGVGLPTDNRSCLLPVGLARWEALDLQAWSVVLWGLLALWQDAS